MLGAVTRKSARVALVQRLLASPSLWVDGPEGTMRRPLSSGYSSQCRAFSSNHHNNSKDQTIQKRKQKRRSRPETQAPVVEGRNNNNNHPRHPRPSRSSTSTPSTTSSSSPISQSNKPRVVLNQFMEALNRIQMRLDEECEPQSPIWSPNIVNHNHHQHDDQEGALETTHIHPEDDDNIVVDTRQELYHVTQRVVQLIQEYANEHPSTVFQHTHEFTNLCSGVLKVYAQLLVESSSSTSSNTTIFDDTMTILQNMRDWKLNIQQQHVDAAMEIAARLEQWQVASRIFWDHIDPDQSGYHPYDISIDQPVGLYVIAKGALEQGQSPVEAVMEAVLRMTMVSPGDESKCEYNTYSMHDVGYRWTVSAMIMSMNRPMEYILC